MTDIIKPYFTTPPEDFDVYPYLASAGVGKSTLLGCCVHEAEVTGVDSRTSVRVLLDSVTYADVPVWVNTDIGSRNALLSNTEEVDAVDYFKDSGLMFPFKGGEVIGELTTKTPKVLVAVYTDPETEARTVICVLHVLENMFSTFADEDFEGWKTYRMYVKVKLLGLYDTIEYCLYDVIENEVATLPTIVDSSPVLPMIEAQGIDPADEDIIDNFLDTGVEINGRNVTSVITTKKGDILPGAFTTFGQTNSSQGAPCYNEDGSSGGGWIKTSNETLNYPDPYGEVWESSCLDGSYNLSITYGTHTTSLYDINIPNLHGKVSQGLSWESIMVSPGKIYNILATNFSWITPRSFVREYYEDSVLMFTIENTASMELTGSHIIDYTETYDVGLIETMNQSGTYHEIVPALDVVDTYNSSFYRDCDIVYWSGLNDYSYKEIMQYTTYSIYENDCTLSTRGNLFYNGSSVFLTHQGSVYIVDKYKTYGVTAGVAQDSGWTFDQDDFTNFSLSTLHKVAHNDESSSMIQSFEGLTGFLKDRLAVLLAGPFTSADVAAGRHRVDIELEAYIVPFDTRISLL